MTKKKENAAHVEEKSIIPDPEITQMTDVVDEDVKRWFWLFSI